MARTLLAVAAVGLFVGGSAGCLVVSGSSIEESGIRVTDSTFKQVQIGETTSDWLVATLGDPTTRTPVSDVPHVEILKYEYTERTSKGGAVFLIFAGGSEKTRTRTTYFEVTDGVVSRYWTEQ